MKHTHKLLLSLLIAVPLLYACGESSSSSSTTSVSTSSTSSSEVSSSIVEELTVPSNVALTGRRINWDEVAVATGYDVRLNGTDEYETTTNQFDVDHTYFGPLSIEVRATRGEEATAYSSPTNVVAILELAAPTNVRQDGSIVLWDAVLGATGYIVKINDVENFTLETSYQITVTEPSSVQILATGRTDGYIVSSPFSDILYIKVPLMTPTGIAYDNGLVSWNAVANASSYIILINDTNEFTSPINSVTISIDFVGSVNIKVKAVATGDQYVDSAWGQTTLSIAPITLAQPTNLRLTGDLLEFDAVIGATGYDIYVDGTMFASVTTNSYTLNPTLLAQTGSYLQVKATSSIHTSSILSEKVYLGAQAITNETELRAIVKGGAYTLANDIALTSEWTPLDFEGFFDGNGHTISGIDIDATSASLSEIGFFKKVEGAIIRNVELVGAIDVTTAHLEAEVGALAGSLINSTIEMVTVDVDVTVVSNNGTAKVGGAIGSTINSDLTRVIYDGAIHATHAISGGLVGLVRQSSATARIHQSAALGSILVVGGEQSPTGGFIGQLLDNYMEVTESKAEITVTGPNYVGGFVGYMGNGTISNSYSMGTVTATSTNIVHIGGFIGRMEGYNNKVNFSIAQNLVVVSAGTNIYAGSFVGVTPGGTIATLYTSCVYNSTISSRDRIGNPDTGRGDGIIGVSALGLLTLSSFNQQIWDFSGDTPRLSWE